MRKLFLGLASTVMVFSGCQQIQDAATSLRKGGETAINQASQQAENIKTQAIQTKQKFDEKSQQVINTVDDINKLGK